jgi:hypothetical protein
LIRERPERITDELTRAYNAVVAAALRVCRSTILRAVRRSGYVFKNTTAAGQTGS